MDFSYLGQDSSTTDTSSYTFSSMGFGDPDPDRYIIVPIVVKGGVGTAINVTSCTIGGQSANLYVTQAGTSETFRTTVAIAVAHVPSGATGNIVVTTSRSVYNCVIGRYRALRLTNIVPHHTIQSTSDNPSGSLNVPERGLVIGVATSITSNSVSWTGATSNFNVEVESYGRTTAASAYVPAGQTGRPVGATFNSNYFPAGRFASWQLNEKPPGGGFLLFF